MFASKLGDNKNCGRLLHQDEWTLAVRVLSQSSDLDAPGTVTVSQVKQCSK